MLSIDQFENQNSPSVFPKNTVAVTHFRGALFVEFPFELRTALNESVSKAIMNICLLLLPAIPKESLFIED